MLQRPSLAVRRLSHALGAEILGLDLAQPLDDATVAAVRAIWLEHQIVLFRGQQQLTPEQHISFTRRFGEVDRNDNAPAYRMPAHPEITEVTNRRHDDGRESLTRDLGRSWHSDLEYTVRPAQGSLLWCGQVPEVGGDTMFANMYLAYETLSEGLKAALAGLRAAYDVKLGLRADGQVDPATFDAIHGHNACIAQPVVRVHPETGRKSLFVSQRVDRFVGWTREESAPLLQYLCAHATRPEHVLRKSWQPGDLLMWDNRCVIHQALADYDRSQIRYMRRTAVLGEPSGYVVSTP